VKDLKKNYPRTSKFWLATSVGMGGEWSTNSNFKELTFLCRHVHRGIVSRLGYKVKRILKVFSFVFAVIFLLDDLKIR